MAEEKNTLYLRVAGGIYGGWTEVGVKTSMEQIAGTFELSLTEKWVGQSTEWTIPPGERCTIDIGEDTVITGYVDQVSVDYDANSHTIKVNGRDATGDLVDCSAPSKVFSGLTFLQIATELTGPYGITVYDETFSGKKLKTKQAKAGKKGTPPKKQRIGSKLSKCACQNGETVYKTIEKLARSEGVLPISDGEGGLIITRAGLGGDCKTILRQGENILSASFEQSNANLYSDITVKGQIAGLGQDRFDLVNSSPKGNVSRKVVTSKNSMIKRYRPLIIVAESQADAKRCQQRAAWEASSREAKSRRLSVVVQGWREPDTGDLWEINKRVRVISSWLRIDETWLIAGVNYRLSEAGTTAELTLCNENAFEELPEIPEPDEGAVAANRFKLTKDK